MLACDANGADRVMRGLDGKGTYLVTPKAPGAIVEREKRAAGVLVAELVSAVRRKSDLVSLGSLKLFGSRALTKASSGCEACVCTRRSSSKILDGV